MNLSVFFLFLTVSFTYFITLNTNALLLDILTTLKQYIVWNPYQSLEQCYLYAVSVQHLVSEILAYSRLATPADP